jgi:hypothetical protein
MTAILRIEHPVGDCESWRRAFDSDPEGRERNGVCCRYRLTRACEDPNFVLIDLEFDAPAPAEAFSARLRKLWARVDVVHDPEVRVALLVEERSLVQSAEQA